MNLNVRPFPTLLYWKCVELGAKQQIDHGSYIINTLAKATGLKLPDDWDVDTETDQE